MKYIAILLIVSLGAAASYEHYILRPKQEAEITSLNEEIASLKESLKAKRTAPKIQTEKTSPVHTEPLAVRSAPKQNLPQEAAQFVQDNSTEIAALEAQLESGRRDFESQEAYLEGEINRGRAARKTVSESQGNFQELRGNRGIRTSDADREAWEADKRARLGAIDAKLNELEAQKNTLENNFEVWESNLRKQIRDLK